MGEHRAPFVVTNLGRWCDRRGKGEVRDEHVDVSRRPDELFGCAGLRQRFLTREDLSAVFQKAVDEGRPHEVTCLRYEHAPASEAFAKPGHAAS